MSVLLPARSIVVAPRLPAKPKVYTGDPFTADADIVLDCDQVDAVTGKPCGWHAFGPRKDMKAAVQEHNQMYHPNQIGTVLLNQPRQ